MKRLFIKLFMDNFYLAGILIGDRLRLLCFISLGTELDYFFYSGIELAAVIKLKVYKVEKENQRIVNF